MKVTQTNSNTKKIGDLTSGDCFMYGDVIYMLVDTLDIIRKFGETYDGERLYIVNLKNGGFNTLDEECMVIPLPMAEVKC